ncbi:ribonuclease HII [Acidobacteriota bacterium]
MADFQIEKKILKEGFKAVAGVDEAGRGALFGPVVAGAVMFPIGIITTRKLGWIKDINDSKLISPNKRKRLAKEILIHSFSIGIGIVSNLEIDLKNIYWASLEAMKKAVKNMAFPPDFLLIDGLGLNDVHCPQMGITKGDRKSTSIAAASIVAKVFRDEMMIQLDKVYKGYEVLKNKGYGTEEHFNALQEKGPTSFHRLTFNLDKKKGR